LTDAEYHERYGSWIQTASSRQFWPLDPRGEDLNIHDIAHALAHQCRFTGHTREFYSVAQHSVLAATLVPEELALDALMHDASEAYLADIAKPIKADPRFGTIYKEFEEKLMRIIAARFNFDWPLRDEVKQADAILLHGEASQLLGPQPSPWIDEALARACPRILPWRPEIARETFLDLYFRVVQSTGAGA
jgi:uncharacterized protein